MISIPGVAGVVAVVVVGSVTIAETRTFLERIPNLSINLDLKLLV